MNDILLIISSYLGLGVPLFIYLNSIKRANSERQSSWEREIETREGVNKGKFQILDNEIDNLKRSNDFIKAKCQDMDKRFYEIEREQEKAKSLFDDIKEIKIKLEVISDVKIQLQTLLTKFEYLEEKRR